MESLLYQVGVHDAITCAGVAAVVTGVRAIATLLPAYRATRVDPVTTLRAERTGENFTVQSAKCKVQKSDLTDQIAAPSQLGAPDSRSRRLNFEL